MIQFLPYPPIASLSDGGFQVAFKERACVLQVLFGIGFGGALLFLLVDRYEKDKVVASLLRFMVLAVSGLAILHKLRPLGFALF